MNRKAFFLTVLLTAALVLAAGSAWLLTRGSGPMQPSRSAKTGKYHCPMHPKMISDRPGDCPICQMRMVPMDAATEGAGTVDAGADAGTSGAGTKEAGQPEVRNAPSKKKILYRSTMNPNEISDRPGKDSMGMEMVPVEVEEEAPAARASVEGLSPVRISLQKQQLIGVKTTAVAVSPLRRTVRAVGRVTFDETRLHHIHTKVSGYVERLHANATGELVRKGEPLVEIYSPELLASQQEYLVALAARARTSGSSLPSVAPMSGTVIQRNVTHGERVGPEMTLLELADLSRVWVLASVYEYELPFVREGEKATMSLSYVPGVSFEGRVSKIYPVLDAATRTAQVRLEFPNPGLVLKPEMYAEVQLVADLGKRLAVPDTAVMETGTRSIVFVDRGEGFFEPREISIGLRLPDRYEVLGGLREGEKVLTAGHFFIDSESRLKAALAETGEGSTGSHR
ncbi:MAG: efflux RND transporter periplasmic adaptor subunit [Acidobacteria bacterium]|nr:MAG: efflux RND transporter periplasmic adaptor subunit [Acidobacteriota bacterium]